MDPQIVLVTGASSGIGQAAARLLAERGHHVIATARRKELLESLRETLPGASLDVVFMDVTDPVSVHNAKVEVDEITNGYGVDVLVNNAGFVQAGPVEEVSDAELRAQFETNIFGLLRVTRTWLPAMRARRGGRIVNVSSVAGRIAVPCLGVYDSTKFCLEGLSDSLRLELKAYGVQVVLVEPGAIHTDLSELEQRSLARKNTAESAYRGHLEAVMSWQKGNHAKAPGPEVVARAIVRATESRRPKARYVAPATYLPLIGLCMLLPTAWSDAIIRRVVGIGNLRVS
ncbi:MAG: SDR family oxidoreductase [Pseudomonadales bacterium]